MASKFLPLKRCRSLSPLPATMPSPVVLLRSSDFPFFVTNWKNLPSGYPCRHQFILHATSRVLEFLYKSLAAKLIVGTWHYKLNRAW
ncbi:hypothetical protein P8452_08897 [Trifolium repens]|nr:hypothetical protein P8452_08897 [Trifolium repens]